MVDCNHQWVFVGRVFEDIERTLGTNTSEIDSRISAIFVCPNCERTKRVRIASQHAHIT